MQICMQFSSGISSLVSGRFVHVPNKAPINNTNNNIIFPTVVFTLQLEECRLQGVRRLAVNANVSG